MVVAAAEGEEGHDAAVARRLAHAEHVAVEGERSLEVANAQHDVAERTHAQLICHGRRRDVPAQAPVTALVISGTSGSGSLSLPERAKAWASSDIFFQVLRMISSHFSSEYSACWPAKPSM